MAATWTTPGMRSWRGQKWSSEHLDARASSAAVSGSIGIFSIWPKTSSALACLKDSSGNSESDRILRSIVHSLLERVALLTGEKIDVAFRSERQHLRMDSDLLHRDAHPRGSDEISTLRALQHEAAGDPDAGPFGHRTLFERADIPDAPPSGSAPGHSSIQTRLVRRTPETGRRIQVLRRP